MLAFLLWSLTGTVGAAVRLAGVGLEGEVKLSSEQSPVVGVDQLEDALMDHVRLKTQFTQNENLIQPIHMNKVESDQSIRWSLNMDDLSAATYMFEMKSFNLQNKAERK